MRNISSRSLQDSSLLCAVWSWRRRQLVGRRVEEGRSVSKQFESSRPLRARNQICFEPAQRSFRKPFRELEAANFLCNLGVRLVCVDCRVERLL